MISLDKFINKYVGKSVGVPWNKALDGECVSMVQRYINECHNQPLKVRGHAVAFGDTLVRDRVAKVVTKPQYGDIIVWGKNMGGGYGHVAVYLNEKSLFDQNNSSVKPTRTSQVRPMIKIKPIQYIRMNNKLVVDPKPKPPAKTKEYVYLDKSVERWGIYRLNVYPKAENIFNHLAPKRYGGLTYEILDKPYPNTVTINTGHFGKVNIWIGAGTPHKIIRK